MKNKDDTPNVLSDFLLKLPEERQSELLAQWNWQKVVVQEEYRNARKLALLGGLFVLIGAVVGAAAGVLLTTLILAR